MVTQLYQRGDILAADGRFFEVSSVRGKALVLREISHITYPSGERKPVRGVCISQELRGQVTKYGVLINDELTARMRRPYS